MLNHYLRKPAVVVPKHGKGVAAVVSAKHSQFGSLKAPVVHHIAPSTPAPVTKAEWDSLKANLSSPPTLRHAGGHSDPATLEAPPGYHLMKDALYEELVNAGDFVTASNVEYEAYMKFQKEHPINLVMMI